MNKTRKIIRASMFAAVIFVVTALIKIPVPKGYINLGDAVILISAWILPPSYSFLAASVGSFLSDIVLGYTIYAPVTFLIKGLMALIFYSLYKRLSLKNNNILPFLLGGIVSEFFMVSGYLIFESFLYGFIPSLINTPINLIQGSVSLIVGMIFYKMFNKRGKF